MNRDEAERCIDIAAAALADNQTEKAQRFLEKAQRLFPTDKARGKDDIKDGALMIQACMYAAAVA